MDRSTSHWFSWLPSWRFLRGRSEQGPQIAMMFALLGQVAIQGVLIDPPLRRWLLGGMFVLVMFSLFSELRRQRGRPIAIDRWIDTHVSPRQLTYATFAFVAIGTVAIGVWAFIAYGAVMASPTVFMLAMLAIAFWVALRQLARQGD
ncbi:hypothetical protein [Aeromicrobium piscarium]|uniref:Uncharacterized protein n=1 Tax=Aeromicrobium piscarium TaxID=2590901 RepID=A0A554SPG4_9ACTN|nr:hypothetical protein [Aeromicrobium piscarium]TSD68246.1 hypothetical protein FNM00_01225 [Aeromicrobium piscarium]